MTQWVFPVVDPRIVRELLHEDCFRVCSNKDWCTGTVCRVLLNMILSRRNWWTFSPGVGFGLGKKIAYSYRNQNSNMLDDPNVPDISVSFISDKARLYALDLVHKLRACGVSAIIEYFKQISGQMVC